MIQRTLQITEGHVSCACLNETHNLIFTYQNIFTLNEAIMQTYNCRPSPYLGLRLGDMTMKTR